MISLVAVVETVQAQKISNKIYVDMIVRSEEMPDTFDFRVLRNFYPTTDFYKPKNVSPKKDLEAILLKVERGEEGAEKMLMDYKVYNFPLPEVHSILMIWYENKKDEEKAKYHEWLARGFLTTVMDGIDGSSSQSPYVILNADEADMIIKILGYVRISQRKVVLYSRNYAVVKVRDVYSQSMKEIWFDNTEIVAAEKKLEEE